MSSCLILTCINRRQMFVPFASSSWFVMRVNLLSEIYDTERQKNLNYQIHSSWAHSFYERFVMKPEFLNMLCGVFAVAEFLVWWYFDICNADWGSVVDCVKLRWIDWTKSFSCIKMERSKYTNQSWKLFKIIQQNFQLKFDDCRLIYVERFQL